MKEQRRESERERREREGAERGKEVEKPNATPAGAYKHGSLISKQIRFVYNQLALFLTFAR
jgi:hypothetical protein